MPDSWKCQHLSLSNPRSSGATDLPKLLRRVATEVSRRRLDPMEILDLVISQEMTEDGPWWSATLYFDKGKPPGK